MSRSKVFGCLYVALAAVIWGSNGVIVNMVPLNAYAIAFFRVLFASLTLAPVTFLTRKKESVEALGSWGSLAVIGALLGGGWALAFQSMKLIPIANAVFLFYTGPVFATLFAPMFLKEKIEKTTIPALVISTVGVAMISLQHGFSIQSLNVVGVIFALLSSLTYAAFVIVAKKTVAGIPSQILTMHSCLMAAALLSPSLIGVNLTLDAVSWTLLVCLGAFNTGFAYTLYYKGLNLIKAQKAVVLTYLEPVSATVFGAIFLAQRPTTQTLIGGLLILTASYIATSG